MRSVVLPLCFSSFVQSLLNTGPRLSSSPFLVSRSLRLLETDTTSTTRGRHWSVIPKGINKRGESLSNHAPHVSLYSFTHRHSSSPKNPWSNRVKKKRKPLSNQVPYVSLYSFIYRPSSSPKNPWSHRVKKENHYVTIFPYFIHFFLYHPSLSFKTPCNHSVNITKESHYLTLSLMYPLFIFFCHFPLLHEFLHPPRSKWIIPEQWKRWNESRGTFITHAFAFILLKRWLNLQA